MKEKETRGGIRQGSGAKPKYSEETKNKMSHEFTINVQVSGDYTEEELKEYF